MPYKKDSWGVSLIWGRIGAAVLAVAAFGLGIWGYTVTPEDVVAGETLIGGILAGFAGILALISKVRESKKADE